MNKTISYRPEIDGLRAIAVLPVIFFHAGFSCFSGGFLGVDVFFVISGYLITSIMIHERKNNTFLLAKFYRRRVRRLLPSLTLILLCLVLFGYLFLLPKDLVFLRDSVVSVASFSSNLYFWSSLNYFSPASEEQLLLHTWSLAIEEQYYLFFPVLLLLAWRFKRSKILATLLIVALISLVMSQLASSRMPVANFYLLPTRAWELMCGSILAFLPTNSELRVSDRGKDFFAFLGFLAILLSIFLLDKSHSIPSFWALVPVLGTCLIILFADQNTLTGRLLAIRPLTGIGLISYSLYLWHQPIFAGYKQISLYEADVYISSLLILLTFLLAFVSTRFLEEKVRSSELSLRTGLVVFWVVSLFAVVVFQYRITNFSETGSSQGALSKVSPVFEQGDCNLHGGFESDAVCRTAETSKVLLWGDSFAMHLQSALSSNGIEFYQSAMYHCFPNFFVSPYSPGTKYGASWSDACLRFNQSVLKFLKEQPRIDTVVLSSSFFSYQQDEELLTLDGTAERLSREEREESFVETIRTLKEIGLDVVVVAPGLLPEYDLSRCLEREKHGLWTNKGRSQEGCDFRITEASDVSKKANEFAVSLSRSAGAEVIDLASRLCRIEVCLAAYNHEPLYSDRIHFSHSGFSKFAVDHSLFKELQVR